MYRRSSKTIICNLTLATLLLSVLPLTSAAQDAAKDAAFRQAVSDARFSMSERDMAAAKKHLEQARQNAQTDAQLDEVDRLDVLLDYLNQFWDLIREGMGKLQATEELKIKDTRIAVVETGPNLLIVKAAGRLRTYRTEDMPTSLVMALAERSLAHDAVSKVAVGTFLAFDKKGDRKVARQLWTEAAKAGADINHLLPELDMAPGTGGGTTPVPNDPARLRAAEQLVKQKFAAEYAKATNLLAQTELAEKLLAVAKAGSSNLDAQFVAFREARDMAVTAGKAALACEAIDEMAKVYAVDAWAMKADTLARIVKTARGSRAQREVATTALELAKKAFGIGRADAAAQLVEVALEGARASKNRMLMQQAVMAQREIEALKK